MAIRISGINDAAQIEELPKLNFEARPITSEASDKTVTNETAVTQAKSSPTTFAERNVVSSTRQSSLLAASTTNIATFDYNRISGFKNNPNVTSAFLHGVEQLTARIKTQPEYLLAVMSFETGGSFSPAERNSIGATGLIQFLPSTAKGLGTTTEALARMSSTEQLGFVEKYFEPFKGNLGELEQVYTAVLSGSPRSSPDSVLFRRGTAAYAQNPLDWNRNGEITAAEATTPVAARMVGGTSNVQQRLFDLGFAGATLQSRFVDGAWGSNTANAVADFQRSRGLPSNGNLNAVTARALFNLSTPPAPPTNNSIPPANNAGLVPPAGLQRGNTGANVGTLQERLVQFGHLSRADQQTGVGTFGAKTEGALKAFQRANSMSPSGKFDNATRKAMEDILAGVGRDRNPNQDVTRGLQNKLVEAGYMTQAQVNTAAPGTFSPQTEIALKRFQADRRIEQTGVLGATTYNALRQATPRTGGAGGSTEATNGRHYTVNQGILVTNELLPRLNTLADSYFARTGQNLRITSGYRPPARQASVMYDLIANRGVSHVRNLYADKTAVGQIINAYNNNRSDREAATLAMANVIQNQVNNGTFISSHLRSRAMDVSTGANLSTLRSVVNEMGGTVINEGDHYHVQL